MAVNRTGQTIRLKDGRSLGYAEFGNLEGKPVFYFHGFPGSRLDWTLSDAEDSAAQLNVRIIAIDRPGIGFSSFKRDREILDWPDDVSELADALQIDRFAVLGISGGGPYACACAFKIPKRLTGTAVVCGMGPAEAPGMKEGGCWTFPGKSPVVRRLLFMLFTLALRMNPGQFASQAKASFAEKDRLILSQPEAEKTFIDVMRDAFRSGIGGVNHEATLYTRPWQFRLQDIPGEVHLWHGEDDPTVPVSVGHYVADAIPNCRAVFVKDEVHFSLPHNHIREILGSLI